MQKISYMLKTFLLLVIISFTSVAHASVNLNLILDTSFNPGTGFNNSVFNGFIQPDGKIVLPGVYTSYNGVAANGIIRLNPDGSVDTSFVTNIGTGLNAGAYTAALQSDGKILVGGPSTSFNGVASNRIVRLNADGTRDTSFNIGTGVSAYLNGITVQSDGKILVNGDFSSFNGTSASRIIRLNPDGSVDTSFVTNIGTGFNDVTYFSTIQPDGKILVAARATTFNGIATGRVARLNSDGTLDTAFATNVGTGLNAASGRIAYQPDGKIIVTGSFTSFSGVPTNRIVRLNADGTRDTTFNIGTGFNMGAPLVVNPIQSNGKIIVMGNFASYNGTLRNSIARINSDGSIDDQFDPGVSVSGGFANADIRGESVLFNNKMLIAGTFTAFDGTSRNRIALLKYEDITSPKITRAILSSNNTLPQYAKTGNTITLTFDVDDMPTSSVVSIGGVSVTPNCIDTGKPVITCTASIVVTNTVPANEGAVNFSIVTTSPSGSSEPVTQTTNGSVVTIDRTGPALVVTSPINGNALSTGPQGVGGVCEGTLPVTLSGTGFAGSPITINCVSGYFSTVINVTDNGLWTVTQSDEAGNTTTSNRTHPLNGGVISSGGKLSSKEFTPNTTTVIPQQNTPTVSVPVSGICEAYLIGNIYPDKENNATDVNKLIEFLNTYEKENLKKDGTYDTDDIAAVKRFQLKYADEILTPWGAKTPTGIVANFTRGKINILYCGKKTLCPFFTQYVKPGEDKSDVSKIKNFLNLLMGSQFINTTTLSDSQVVNEIKKYQNLYRETVLKPWDLKTPTGLWYQTTRYSANKMMGCSENSVVLDNGKKVSY